MLYLLQAREDGLKVFAYITGDETAALRAHGLLPAAPLEGSAPEEAPA